MKKSPSYATGRDATRALLVNMTANDMSSCTQITDPLLAKVAKNLLRGWMRSIGISVQKVARNVSVLWSRTALYLLVLGLLNLIPSNLALVPAPTHEIIMARITYKTASQPNRYQYPSLPRWKRAGAGALTRT
jgi:hypothetical protein